MSVAAIRAQGMRLLGTIVVLGAVGASAGFAACAASPPNSGFTTTGGGADAPSSDGGADAGAYAFETDGNGFALPTTDSGTQTGYPTHPWPTSPTSVVIGGSVPPNAPSLFSQAPTSTASPPTLYYPAPNTFFPPNIASILFQWTSSSGNIFWIHFSEGADTLDVYTDGSDPTCEAAAPGVAKCWASTAADLMLNFGHAADTSTGTGGEVTFSIASLDTTKPGASKEVTPTYTLHVARLDIAGAIFYWSTTAQGIRRATFDATDAGVTSPPIDYVTADEFPPTQFFPPGDPNRCMACHTLTRDGTVMATSFLNSLTVIPIVPDVPPPLALGPPYNNQPATMTQAATYNAPSMWTTFSPDKSQIVTVSNVTTTSLTVVSATTGETIQQITVPAGTAGTMPDWSPDGIHLAFADVPMNAINAPGLYFRHLYGSSIGMLDVADGGFSNYQVIAQSTKACPMTQQSGTTESYANPFFSQDGRWLVYSRGDCQSEADPSSEIILSQPVASAPQNHLVTANQQTAAGAVINVENGMPILGPVPANLAADDPNRNFVWVAFTSIRDYGLVLSQDSQVNPQDSGVPSYQVKQIWLAAVDLNQLSAGVIAVDPSYPAFRFPGQDLAENTHRPFWAADVLEGVPIVVKPVP